MSRSLQVAVRGDYAYLVDREAGVQVIDVSDPTSPDIVATRTGYTTQVVLAGDLLFSATDSLEILDVSASPDLSLVGYYGMSWASLYDMAVSEKCLLLAQVDAGIEAVDITNPADPELASAYNTAGLALGVAAESDHAFIADLTSLIAMRVPDITGVEEPSDHGDLLPDAFRLFQNHPNPFNPSTQIAYNVPHGTDVILSVYNILGQQVRTLVDSYKSAGHHTVEWDGSDSHGDAVASGVYFYRLITPDVSLSRKMLLLK